MCKINVFCCTFSNDLLQIIQCFYVPLLYVIYHLHVFQILLGLLELLLRLPFQILLCSFHFTSISSCFVFIFRLFLVFYTFILFSIFMFLFSFYKTHCGNSSCLSNLQISLKTKQLFLRPRQGQHVSNGHVSSSAAYFYSACFSKTLWFCLAHDWSIWSLVWFFRCSPIIHILLRRQTQWKPGLEG